MRLQSIEIATMSRDAKPTIQASADYLLRTTTLCTFAYENSALAVVLIRRIPHKLSRSLSPLGEPVNAPVYLAVRVRLEKRKRGILLQPIQ